MEKELKVPISIRHKWSGKYPYDTPIDQIPCTCKGEAQIACYKMYNTDLNTLDFLNILVWNNCARTLFAAMKRHAAAVPLPDEDCVKEYQDFVDTYVIPAIREKLDNFDYSYSQWYNHLTAPQQAEIDRVRNIDIEVKAPAFDMFCKREIQLIEWVLGVAKIPKNRAIAGAQPEDKHVLGPVTWALEGLFDQHFDGYCGSKNWDELEKTIAQNYKDGYHYVLQGDGSGFDRTQSHEMKYLDRAIYNLLIEKIHHVDPDLFVLKSTARYRKLRGKIRSKDGLQTICNLLIDATVTSGNSDTTLMNTSRMATFCRMMLNKAGVDGRVLAKGDDFVIFLKNTWDIDKLQPIFDKYWARKDEHLNEKHGLGLIYKFLSFGTLDTWDFCSTHLICDYENAKFKIVRQWNRIIDLGAFSLKTLAYSEQEKNQYIYDQVVGMRKWTANMPFYTEYQENLLRLYPGARKMIMAKGKDKKIMKDDGHRHRENAISNSKLGYQHDYSEQLRTSSLEIDPKIVKDFFQEKYGLVYSDKPWRLY